MYFGFTKRFVDKTSTGSCFPSEIFPSNKSVVLQTYGTAFEKWRRPINKAYVKLGGQVIYLGEYRSENSKERYNRLKAKGLVNRHAAKFKRKASGRPTISDVSMHI